MPKQYKEKNSICFHDWINWINKLTLKDFSYCFNLFMFGGPCHLSDGILASKKCSGDLIFLWEQRVYPVMKKNINWYCEYQNSDFELRSAPLNKKPILSL